MASNVLSVSSAPRPQGVSAAEVAADVAGPSALDDAMARLADGDRSALRVVHDGVRGPMMRAAERLLGRGADAEDATQAALVKLFAEAADYDRARRVVPWAVALALFEARTLRRRQQRSRADALDTGRFAAIASTGPSVAGRLEEAELLKLAEELVGTLAEGDRATLEEVLAEREEGRGPAFRKRKQRAIERLRDAWRMIYGA